MNLMKIVSCSSVLALFIASSGCAVTPEPTLDDAASIVVNDAEEAWNLDGATEMRIERKEDGALALVNAPAWQSPASGVWESPEPQGPRIVVGEEGHRWLVEKVSAELDTLLVRASSTDAVDALLEEQIVAKQNELVAAESGLSSAIAPTQSAVSCNFTLYTGASGPVTSPAIAGAAALAQVVCSGGCMSFTVSSQACCSGSCSPVATSSKLVCGTQWTAGIIQVGSGFGSAAVNINPPSLTQTNSSFICQ